MDNISSELHIDLFLAYLKEKMMKGLVNSPYLLSPKITEYNISNAQIMSQIKNDGSHSNQFCGIVPDMEGIKIEIDIRL